MADALQPGAVFAGHRIEGLAGRGGMGVVYRATHIALDHVVALKVISPALAQDERFRRRFGEESRIAVSIRHPNVVAIHHAVQSSRSVTRPLCSARSTSATRFWFCGRSS